MGCQYHNDMYKHYFGVEVQKDNVRGCKMGKTNLFETSP